MNNKFAIEVDSAMRAAFIESVRHTTHGKVVRDVATAMSRGLGVKRERTGWSIRRSSHRGR